MQTPRSAARLVLGLCLAAARTGASELHETSPLYTRVAAPVVIPAEVTGHGLFVSVFINGQGPFRMMVDTGCTCSMITPEVAAAVEARGIDPAADGGVQAVNGFGDVIAMPRVMLDSITVGGVQFEGVTAGVIPLEIQSKIDNRELDGLLGFTLFSDLYFALDYPGQALVLSTEWPRNLPPVRAELVVRENSDVPFVRATVQGQPFGVMIDTGASDRLHLPPAAGQALQWKVEPRPGMLIAVAGETARERVGRLSGDLELGAVVQHEPVVDLSDGPANLGNGFLRGFCLVFHEADDRLWLCSAKEGPVPSPPERTVGLSLLSDPAGWRVAGIIPSSPAEEAGVHKDDLVTGIEGQPARTWTRDRMQAWLDTHESLAVRVETASVGRDLTLRVWALVP